MDPQLPEEEEEEEEGDPADEVDVGDDDEQAANEPQPEGRPQVSHVLGAGEWACLDPCVVLDAGVGERRAEPGDQAGRDWVVLKILV